MTMLWCDFTKDSLQSSLIPAKATDQNATNDCGAFLKAEFHMQAEKRQIKK